MKRARFTLIYLKVNRKVGLFLENIESRNIKKIHLFYFLEVFGVDR